ncbi:hypothetical protein QJS10_CPA02g00050 [Acorus calamus]|uniref:Uncharacterized protein n=1 Tax=Acorus calamus TaxID=4465 RepID=A0AAV9FBT9_ACOCL|nr:hypothetical protein QJS10_CPA02g00050 [Acorus calamus]
MDSSIFGVPSRVSLKALKLTGNKMIPPPGKGSLYIRPLLIGSGPLLGVAPAPDYTFLVYASPVGNYFKEGRAPINLLVEDRMHHSSPGGTGGIKTITNYAPVKERPIPIEELMAADEVFCTGTAIVFAPVSSVTYLGKRVHYNVGELSEKLYANLTGIQMGLLEDKMGWTVELE